MNFIRLTTDHNEMYEKAMDLYKISFPIHEQREDHAQISIMGNDEYYFNLIYDNDVWVGLMLCWETEEFIYVEHFCILPQMRNKQYGQKTLELLNESGKTVILEIDMPEDEISVRRKMFYERCEYCANRFGHVHPPYRKGNEGHRLVVMSYPDLLTDEEYNIFNDYVRHDIMEI